MAITSNGWHRLRHPILLLLILLVTFAAYSRALWNGFTYDDAGFVMVPNNQGSPNHMVAEVQDLGSYFAHHYGHGITPYGRGFRPVTVLSFALVNKLTGRASPSEAPWDFPPWPQHLVNILLHLLGAVLTYLLIARFTAGGVPALLGAAVFGLHALRSDPVISIVGRAEILGFVLGAGATLCYARAVRATGQGKILGLLACAALLFLGCCSKENAMAWVVFVPLYALALDCSEDPERTVVQGIRRQLPTILAVLGPAVLALALWLRLQLNLQHDLEIRPVQNPIYHAGNATRVLTGIMLMGYGLYKVCLPLYLACDYGASVFELVDSIFDYRFLIALLVMAAVLVLGLRGFRRHPLLFLGMCCFLGFSFMTSNILVPVETIFAERVYYTPALGLSFLVAWVAQWVLSRTDSRRMILALVLAVAAWCALGGLSIVRRCAAWQDNDSLFLTDAEGQPRSICMQLNAAEYYRQQGEANEWHGDWKKRWHDHLLAAHALDREDPLPLIALGAYHISFEEMEEAERYLLAAKTSPKLVENQDGADVRRLLAAVAEDRGDLRAAEQYLLEGVELWSHMAGPHVEYARFLDRTNRPEEAEAKLREICEQFPCEPAWMMLVELVRRRNDKVEEQAVLERARAALPKAPRIALALGLLYHEAGRYPEAVGLLEQAYRGRVEEQALRSCRLPLAESLGQVGRQREALEILHDAQKEPKLSLERRARIRELVQKLGGS